MEAPRLFSFRIDETQEEKITFFTYDFLFYQEENCFRILPVIHPLLTESDLSSSEKEDNSLRAWHC